MKKLEISYSKCLAYFSISFAVLTAFSDISYGGFYDECVLVLNRYFTERETQFVLPLKSNKDKEADYKKVKNRTDEIEKEIVENKSKINRVHEDTRKRIQPFLRQYDDFMAQIEPAIRKCKHLEKEIRDKRAESNKVRLTDSSTRGYEPDTYELPPRTTNFFGRETEFGKYQRFKKRIEKSKAKREQCEIQIEEFEKKVPQEEARITQAIKGLEAKEKSSVGKLNSENIRLREMSTYLIAHFVEKWSKPAGRLERFTGSSKVGAQSCSKFLSQNTASIYQKYLPEYQKTVGFEDSEAVSKISPAVSTTKIKNINSESGRSSSGSQSGDTQTSSSMSAE